MSGIGAIIGGVGSILGDFGQMDLQHRYDRSAAESNWSKQLQFAKRSIRWKAQDAIKAGLHPLAALGAQTMSYAPTNVGGSNANISRSMEKLGQGVGDYIAQKDQREYDKKDRALSLEAKKKQLEILDLEIENYKLKGQDTGVMKSGVTTVPAQVTAQEKLGLEKGVHPQNRSIVDPEGRHSLVPSNSEAFSLDENPPSAIKKYGRDALDWNQIRTRPNSVKSMQMVIRSMPPAKNKGWIVKYNPITGTYKEFDPRYTDKTALYWYHEWYENMHKRMGYRLTYGNRKGLPNTSEKVPGSKNRYKIRYRERR